MSYFNTIYADDNLPHRAKTVYLYLADRSGKKGSCWPSINTIARDLGLSRTTVKRGIRELDQHGYLERIPRFRENGSNTSNLYDLK